MCDIDWCNALPTTTLTVNQETDEVLELFFCKSCAMLLQERMANQLGADSTQLNMYKSPIPYTTGDLKRALDYLDKNYD